MKVAIFTIGTEVTDGEIDNSNASWLATELVKLGAQVTHHLSTPDDLSLIQNSLVWLEPQVDWIFVSGGLGPTTDDKTREALAKFAGVSLEFSEAEWQRLNQLHDEKGLATREGHRHQCYFPEGSVPLANPVGSAPGFSLQKGSTKLVALPGPPRELKGVFEQGVRAELTGMKLQAAQLRSWTLLGTTESRAAEIIEDLFKDEDVILGYRASVPYVHVKVWFNNYAEQLELVDQVESKLGRFVVSRDGLSPLQYFTDSIPEGLSLFVLDRYSRGRIAARLSLCKDKKLDRLQLLSEWESSSSVPSNHDLVMTITEVEVDVICSVIARGRTCTDILRAPYKLDPKTERGYRYYVELAIYTWGKLLRAMSATSS